MKIRAFILAIIVLVLLLLVFASAMAMSSANYRLDWYVPVSGSGGGISASPSKGINFTIGQVVTGHPSSSNYDVSLGYWYGVGGLFSIRLPLVTK
jgi:hypothetical protein